MYWLKCYVPKKQTKNKIKHPTQIAHKGHDLGLARLSLTKSVTDTGCSRVNFMLQQKSW